MDNNSTLTLTEVASKPMPLSDHGRYAYWYLRRQWNIQGDREHPFSPDMAPNWGLLEGDEKVVIRKAYQRVRGKYELAQSEVRQRSRRLMAEIALRYVRKRKFFRKLFREDGITLDTLITRVVDEFGLDWLSRANARQLDKNLGPYFKKWERDILRDHTPKKVEPSYWDKLPLYECSGELEATSLRSFKRVDDQCVSTILVRQYKAAYWDVGRDGGGQHEIRFRIFANIPEVACNLVHRLGSIERNGGHIHLNCKRDEAIGRAVYYALRYHLSWTRYLAPLTRRHSRWCPIGATGSWVDAQSVKFAAISANTFGRTGTVEMRLWGTSRKPSDWRFRASLMQAIAFWSEDNAERDCATPINNETAVEAWESFYRWAALHQPGTLRALLNTLKAKARTIGNQRGSIDRFGAAKCAEFVQQFEASDTRLPGYRRGGLAPLAQPATQATDQ
jgi:hypothetical protein